MLFVYKFQFFFLASIFAISSCSDSISFQNSFKIVENNKKSSLKETVTKTRITSAHAGDLLETEDVCQVEDFPELKRLTPRELSYALEYVTGVGLEVEFIKKIFFTPSNSGIFENDNINLEYKARHYYGLQQIVEVIVDKIQNNSLGMLQKIAGCSNDNIECFKAFATNLMKKAYLRDATQEELAPILSLYSNGKTQNLSYQTIVKLAFRAIISSPQFLYQRFGDPDNAFRIASRLASILWASKPTLELIKKIEEAEGKTESLEAVVDSMIEDRKFSIAMKDFFGDWLDFNSIDQDISNSKSYTSFTPDVLKAMQDDTYYYLEQKLIVGKAFELSKLFTDNFLPVSAQTAFIYKTKTPQNAREIVAMGETVRSGLMTHPAILAAASENTSEAIVKRGIFFNERLLCLKLKAPQEPGIPTECSNLGKSTSERDQLNCHKSDQQCASCHKVLDGPGYALQIYDIFGQQIQKDKKGNDVSDNGEFSVNMQDKSISFNNVQEFTTAFVATKNFATCLITSRLSHAIAREVSESDEKRVDGCAVNKIMKDFNQSNKTYKNLMKIIAMSYFGVDGN